MEEGNIFLKKKTKYPRVKTPTILQMEGVECGAAALTMILGYFKKFLPLELMRFECGVSRDGSKSSNMVKAARKMGLEAKGYRKEIEGLVEVKFPAIIFWNFNHFVVLEGIKGNRVFINDPASGKRVVSWEEFDQSYTGVILEFSPTSEFKPGGKKSKTWPLIKKRLVGSKNIVTYVILAGLFLIIPGFIIPTFSRFFVDKILVNYMVGYFKPLLLAMGLTALVKGFLTWLQEYSLLRFQTKLALSSSAKFLEHIFKLPMEFFTQRSPGELTSRIQINDRVAALISEKLAITAINVFSIVFFAILMFQYDVVLTFICIIVVILNLITLKAVSDKRTTGSQKVQQELGKLAGISMSGLRIIETLKASGSENDFFMQWSGQQAKVIKEQQYISLISLATSVIPSVLSKMLTIAILAFGALRVISGDMTMGMLVAFQALMGSFVSPVIALMGLGAEIQTGKADMQRLDDVSAYERMKRFKEDWPEEEQPVRDITFVKPADNMKSPEHVKLQGYVSLKSLSFGYSILEPPLLGDFSLELKPGSRIALVGGSGSGKSTVAKLISGLYAQWGGDVHFDSMPLRELSKKSFSSSVAMVDQDIFMFAGTVKENLTMWDDTVREVDYIQAAKDACIHDVVASRPGAYLSAVEEGGANFSGGQRQRLEIARALTSNPRIIILDEATSALDPLTEKKVDENIRRRGCSCIIVAHRLSTIRDCDEIIVLDHGNIVQRGTHEELIEQAGHYSELVSTM
ncbi:MAG: NHLP family bacteriocin export ABC transporter peptidase/permease/ATPase subunit [Spirochaetaceae bacterium]|nr:NHLP family bacteriocin export ABC transporter peptidase/permease/ATPase subunit [Spirochaetaceae bacterium]